MFIQTKGQVIPAIFVPVFLMVWIGSGFGTLSANSDEKLKKLEFKEIASIGVEEAKTKEEEPYQLSGTASIDCDAEGNIYVLEHTTDTVKKFSTNGIYLKTILTKGDGPREVLNSFGLTINQFTGTLFILQQYGFVIKEYDLDGHSLKRYILPDQFFSIFEFIDKERFIYISLESGGEKDDNCFKIFNIQTKAVEKKFAPYSHEVSFNAVKTYALENDVLWTTSNSLMGLLAFRLKSGEQIKTLDMPGNFKKNAIKIVEEGNGYKLQQRILYNYLQPFLIDRTLYVFFTRQEYKGEQGKGKSYPEKSTLELYRISDNRFRLEERFRGYDNMKFDRVRGNRVLLYTDDPFPRVKVIEVHQGWD